MGLLELLTLFLYPLALTSIITFIKKDGTEWRDIFIFVFLSIIICNLSPSLYILLVTNMRFS
jgi:DMSO/TMAO reductase YedYZ heme-binding membrane subunit